MILKGREATQNYPVINVLDSIDPVNRYKRSLAQAMAIKTKSKINLIFTHSNMKCENPVLYMSGQFTYHLMIIN